jgi:hypothetical protein
MQRAVKNIVVVMSKRKASNTLQISTQAGIWVTLAVNT